MKQLYYKPSFPPKPVFTFGDGLILLGLAAILYGGIRLAFDAPSSWFLDILSRSWLMDFFQRRMEMLNERMDRFFQGMNASRIAPGASPGRKGPGS